jgi:hypothetical protein
MVAASRWPLYDALIVALFDIVLSPADPDVLSIHSSTVTMTFRTIEIEYLQEALERCPMDRRRFMCYPYYSTHMDYSSVVYVNVLWCRLWCRITTVVYRGVPYSTV